jgi:TolB-like protein
MNARDTESGPPSTAAELRPAIWDRIKEHKVLQWSLAYLGAALALAHGQELIGHAFGWPQITNRLTIAGLAVGFPVAIALAWYHGHKGLSRLTAGEMTVISLLLLIGAGLLTALVRAPEKASGELSTVVPVERAAPDITAVDSSPHQPSVSSVAVMPFTNLTGDPTKDYLGDGITEEVINALAQVQGLKVPARTSSFAYKGRNTDIRQIGKDLGVANILEGSVRAEGKRIRVTAQLINALDGLHVWSQTYEEELTGLFKLQDDLAHSIASALKVNLATSGSPAGGSPQNLEAYQLYLQGDAIARTGTPAGLSAGLELARQSVGKDPSFARAHALLAQLRTVTLPSPGPALTEAVAEARGEANLALKLEPQQPTALSTLALIENRSGNWLEAEKYFRASMAADPTDPLTHIAYALFHLNALGHLNDSLAQFREAYRLAPALAVTSAMLAGQLSQIGQDGEAQRYAKQAAQLGFPPDIGWLLYVNTALAAKRGDVREIEDAARQDALSLPIELQRAGGEAALKETLLAVRDPRHRPTASRLLHELLARVDDGQLDPDVGGRIAVWYANIGDLNSAFAQATHVIEQVQRAGYPGYSVFWTGFWRPEAQELRRDPRFQKFLSRLGMMEYWKQYGPPDECDLRDQALVCR